MSNKRWASPEVHRKLKSLVVEGYGPSQVYQELDRQGMFAEWRPSRKTIERMVRAALPSDPSSPWAFSDPEADPEQARLVVDVAALLVDVSSGERCLSKETAKWVARVRTAAPTIPPEWALTLAWAYQSHAVRDVDGVYLDLVLGIKPWEGDEDCEIGARWSHILHIVERSGWPIEPFQWIGDTLLAIEDSAAHHAAAASGRSDSNVTAAPVDNGGQG